MKRKLYSKFHFASVLFLPLKQHCRNLVVKPLIAVAFLFISATSSAQTGEALHFDGTDDLVTLPFVVSGSYTKEAWIYPTILGGYHNVISGENTALYINGSQLAGGNAFDFNAVKDPGVMATYTWYHIAITYNDATKLLSLYKNGILVDDSVLTASYTETISYLGAVQYFGSPLAFYGGQMDEVRFWNYDRSAAEIAANMSCNLTGDEPGLTAYYKFNQGTASGSNPTETTLADSVDKCIPTNGTLSNFALTGNESNWVAQGFPGNGVTGTCANNFANITVIGNSVCITSADASPTTADHTDFGTYSGTPIVRTFTITNSGNTALTITTPVTITGSEASHFAVTSQPSTSVAPGASTTFQVTFTSMALGTSNATVNITNSDGDEGTFTFAITGSATVLPVELISFRGEKSNDMSRLVWLTASEQNNRGFEIHRSSDGTSNWENIGFVNAGTSTGVNTYSFTDRLPMKGTNAYRLKQVDFDGRFKYSNVVVLNFTGAGSVISFYPNPVKNKLNLQFNDNSLLNTEALVSTVTGKVVSKIKLTSNRQQIDLSSLPQGIYMLSFSNGEVKRIVKQ